MLSFSAISRVAFILSSSTDRLRDKKRYIFLGMGNIGSEIERYYYMKSDNLIMNKL